VLPNGYVWFEGGYGISVHGIYIITSTNEYRSEMLDLIIQLEYFHGTDVHVINGSNVLTCACSGVMVRRAPLVFFDTLLR
jgi:hypothetical protein